MANGTRLPFGSRGKKRERGLSRDSVLKGERHSVDQEQKCQLEASSAAVGIVSSVTWTIGTCVEANLWPDLVVKG